MKNFTMCDFNAAFVQKKFFVRYCVHKYKLQLSLTDKLEEIYIQYS